jgi:hypothetical protein
LNKRSRIFEIGEVEAAAGKAGRRPLSHVEPEVCKRFTGCLASLATRTPDRRRGGNAMKEAVAYCRTACAKESDPSAEVQLQEQMVRRYADARGHFAWPQRGKW